MFYVCLWFRSIVYSLDVDGQLLTHQKIHLTAADFIIVFDDFAFSSSQSIPLSSADSNVFASFLHEFNKSVTIYIWESESSQFIFFQKLSFDRIHSISTLADPYTYESLSINSVFLLLQNEWNNWNEWKIFTLLLAIINISKFMSDSLNHIREEHSRNGLTLTH